MGRGRGSRHDHRPADGRRAVALLRLDHGLRGEAAGVEAPPPAPRAPPAHLPHPAAGHREGEGRLRRMPLVVRDPARPALRGHAGALGRRVRARLRGDPRDRAAAATSSSSPRWRRTALPLRGAARVLSVGIGGGGDVVGALATAAHARTLGASAVVGGITWERRPIDPLPGPRRLDEVIGAEVLNETVALAGPETVRPGRRARSPSRTWRATSASATVLVDPNPGPAAVAAGSPTPRERLGCDTSRWSTSAATCSPTATSRGSPARWPTRSCSRPPAICRSGPAAWSPAFSAPGATAS